MRTGCERLKSAEQVAHLPVVLQSLNETNRSIKSSPQDLLLEFPDTAEIEESDPGGECLPGGFIHMDKDPVPHMPTLANSYLSCDPGWMPLPLAIDFWTPVQLGAYILTQYAVKPSFHLPSRHVTG